MDFSDAATKQEELMLKKCFVVHIKRLTRLFRVLHCSHGKR